MTPQHCLKPLAAVACAAWCVSFSYNDPAPTRELGVIEIQLDEARTGHSVAPLGFDGKLVFHGRELAGGELATKGRGLVLNNGEGQGLNYEDLVFTFDAEGSGGVYAGSMLSRRLFDLADMTVQWHDDGSLLLVAELRMTSYARILAKPELESLAVGAVSITANAEAVRRLPIREIVRPTEEPKTEALGGIPDVIVWDIGVTGGDPSDIHYWGQNPAGTKAAYSIATQSCNKGTALLDWYFGGAQLAHPVIAQNMFRYANGEFEQIGQSWLKHAFCAVSETETGCAPCGATNCDTLGIGCADTYWATLNDGRAGGSKTFVNGLTGQHTHLSPSPTGNNTIRGRLQVAVTDIDPAQNPGAAYFIEGQYVTADDAAANASDNNTSWRPINVNSISNLTGGGPTNREEPAIFAWRDQDPSVTIRTIAYNEGSIRAYYFLGYKATSLGGGMWRYEYALQNLNSDQSAASFTVPVDAGVTLSNIGFHDVDYHSGDPYTNVDWVGVQSPTEVTWATEDFATNANANALRWGTLYNFRFDADSPPDTADLTIGLFKPGAVSSVGVSGGLAPAMTCTASILDRNAGANPVSYTASVPVLGGSITATVDLTTTGHTDAVIFGFAGSLSLTLGGGQVLLADFTDVSGELLMQTSVSGPMANFSIPVANDVNLCGLALSTQALHFGGGAPFALSNAKDMVVGN